MSSMSKVMQKIQGSADETAPPTEPVDAAPEAVTEQDVEQAARLAAEVAAVDAATPAGDPEAAPEAGAPSRFQEEADAPAAAEPSQDGAGTDTPDVALADEPQAVAADPREAAAELTDDADLAMSAIADAAQPPADTRGDETSLDDVPVSEAIAAAAGEMAAELAEPPVDPDEVTDTPLDPVAQTVETLDPAEAALDAEAAFYQAETAQADVDPVAEVEAQAARPTGPEPVRHGSGLFSGAAIAAAPADTPATHFDERTAEWDAKRVDPVIVAFHDRYSAVCEQYRAVRARLMTMNTTHAQQIIAVTSSIPEEGKSVTTINLGLVMAEGGEHRILIADADFRRTSIARMLGLRGKPGLADVLRGEISLEDAVQHTPFPNLKVLPAGEVRNNAYADVLGSPSTISKLDELRAAFDYTFVDTPPVTTVSDVCLIAPHCDGAIMVVEMRRTPEPTVQQAVRTLQANNVKILGSLLSRFRDRGSGYYEHYYSYYYNR